jgi:hypothetical protein
LPYNGSGSFTLPSNSWNPAVANTAITADDWNAVANDLALGLTTAMTRDGQSATTARIPFALGLSATGAAASAVAYAATSDLDTGVYFPAANQVALSAGGVGVITATSSLVTIAVPMTFTSGSITGNLTLSGNLTVNGNTTIGDTSGDTLTVNATSTFVGPVTVPDASFANAKLANMATQTIKGRTTAGTGVPEDLSATQATAILNAFTGDSGSGGVKGLVPAPAAGTAADRFVLNADGTFKRQSVFAFALINGASGAIVESFNIATASAASGVYDFTFTDAAASGNYTINATCRNVDATGFALATVSHTTPPTTTGFRVYVSILTIGPTITQAACDFLYVTVYQ